MSQVVQSSIDDDAFNYIRKLLLDQAAIALEPTKSYLVEARLTPLARRHGLSGVIQLVQRLQQQPIGSLHEEVIDAMTTNETSFFRDLHPFEAMKSVVIPELIERRQQMRTLRIWSAACSSGQEAYSIAMLLNDEFPELSNWSVTIHATDLSQEMLKRASEGCYSQAEINRGLPAHCLVRYFERVDTQWRIKPEIRKSVRFQQLNLTHGWTSLPQMDIVFMRNVLIYFKLDTKRQIIEQVHQQLARDGTLFLGGAESTLGVSEKFDRVNLGSTTIYRPLDA